MISAIEANRRLNKLVNNKVDEISKHIENKINQAIENYFDSVIVFLEDNLPNLVLDELEKYLMNIGYKVIRKDSTDKTKMYLTISW